MRLPANSKGLVLSYRKIVVDAVEPVNFADRTLEAEF